MSKMCSYENLYAVTGGIKHTGSKTNLRINVIDRKFWNVVSSVYGGSYQA